MLYARFEKDELEETFGRMLAKLHEHLSEKKGKLENAPYEVEVFSNQGFEEDPDKPEQMVDMKPF